MQPMNIACTGATTWNGLISDQERNGTEIRSQLKQVQAGSEPTTVLMSVGANDVRWATFLLECARSNCATTTHTRAFQGLLVTAKAGVASSLTSLRVMGADRVYVTGYYDPFSGSGASAESLGFTAHEVAWYQARLAELNHMLREATISRPYATYVPLDLSSQSARTIQSLSEPVPFHPTVAGHELIADTILKAVR
jgi:hypothetical protein